MCTILFQVILSAVAGLVWCALITCLYLFIELVFSKKGHRSVLTNTETILLKEILAGRISLPAVAIGRVFEQETEKLETIITGFTTVTDKQITYLDSILEKLTTQLKDTIYIPLEDEISPLTIDEDVIPDLIYGEEFPNNTGDHSILMSGKSFSDVLNDAADTSLMTSDNDNPIGDEMFLPEEKPEDIFKADYPLLKEEHLQQLALVLPLREIKLPGIGRNILEKFGCRSVHDALLIMLKHGSRNALLEIPFFGMESIHTLELHMVQERLLKVDTKTGNYTSDFWDEEKYDELQDREKND
ncbi:MAG: hypothetical protein LBV72_15670 [Tannerella sp.]|jgi:hypothetical protein|nr:hypothetical protein [Tannerella sp.]